jgi:hypothetical protein
MTGPELATLSTLAGLVATVALFILLAGWSTDTSWGLTASIVRGVLGWSGRDGAPAAAISPSDQTLRPMQPPVRERLWAAAPTVASDAETEASAHSVTAAEPSAEIEDLGSRRLA